MPNVSYFFDSIDSIFRLGDDSYLDADLWECLYVRQAILLPRLAVGGFYIPYFCGKSTQSLPNACKRATREISRCLLAILGNPLTPFRAFKAHYAFAVSIFCRIWFEFYLRDPVGLCRGQLSETTLDADPAAVSTKNKCTVIIFVLQTLFVFSMSSRVSLACLRNRVWWQLKSPLKYIYNETVVPLPGRFFGMSLLFDHCSFCTYIRNMGGRLFL